MHRFMKLERGPWERGRGLRGRKSWSTCDVKVGRRTTRRQNGIDKKGPGKLGEESCHKKAYFMLIYKERINIKKVQQVENQFPPQSYWNGGIPFSSAVPSEARAQPEPRFSEAMCSSSILSPQLPRSSPFRTASIQLDGEPLWCGEEQACLTENAYLLS